MEQPRPLRRRRRSSRRSAGPPGPPGAGAASDAPTALDQVAAAPTTGAPSTQSRNENSIAPDVRRGEPRPDDAEGDGIAPPQTPGEASDPSTQPVAATVVANSSFAAPADLDDPLAGTTAAPGAPHPFAGSPGTAASTGPTHLAEHGRPAGEGPRRSYRTPREDQSERSLRALVTTRSTQVSPTAAMRAREVAVPTAADVLAAEADLVVVRRHYVPPTALAAGRRRDRTERRPSGGGQAGGGQTGRTPSGGGAPTGQQPT